VAHVGVANPYCPEWPSVITGRRPVWIPDAQGRHIRLHWKVRSFQPRRNPNVYRSMGFSVIGMTNAPNLSSAREAEICYASVALVTDYDVWKEKEPVTVEMVIAT